MKEVQLGTVTNARVHFAVVLWGFDIEKDYGAAHATQRAEHSGDCNASFHVGIYYGLDLMA
jgi:hypothetical protein